LYYWVLQSGNSSIAHNLLKVETNVMASLVLFHNTDQLQATPTPEVTQQEPPAEQNNIVSTVLILR